MRQSSTAVTAGGIPELPDFSVVLGGPLYQLFRRARLSGDGLELLRRRIVIITAIVWLPLLVLSIIDGHAYGDSVKIPFLYDVAAHARFLVAVPILVLAELIVHLRVSPVLRRFVERGIIVPEDFPKLNEAIASAARARNSVALEVGLLVFVYTVGIWLWWSGLARVPTWYAQPDANGVNLTLPGYWLGFVSIPIFQFILLRWYLRYIIWFRLLRQVSKLNLQLSAAHPDRAGGLGFLGKATYAFGPILFAQGAVLSGLIAVRVLFEGRDLLSFKMEVVGMIAVMVLFVAAPLLMFTPQMDKAKRKSGAEYALLANRYVFGFEEKWIRSGVPETGELLGAADLQSLADMGHSYSVIGEMHVVPFTLKDLGRLAIAAAVPLLPLAFTIFSVEEVLTRLLKILI